MLTSVNYSCALIDFNFFASQVAEHKLVSASRDKTIVIWNFKRKVPLSQLDKELEELMGIDLEEALAEAEDRVPSHEATEESAVDYNYMYQPRVSYFSDLPLDTVLEDTPDCCGFLYQHWNDTES